MIFILCFSWVLGELADQLFVALATLKRPGVAIGKLVLRCPVTSFSITHPANKGVVIADVFHASLDASPSRTWAFNKNLVFAAQAIGACWCRTLFLLVIRYEYMLVYIPCVIYINKHTQLSLGNTDLSLLLGTSFAIVLGRLPLSGSSRTALSAFLIVVACTGTFTFPAGLDATGDGLVHRSLCYGTGWNDIRDFLLCPFHMFFVVTDCTILNAPDIEI